MLKDHPLQPQHQHRHRYRAQRRATAPQTPLPTATHHLRPPRGASSTAAWRRLTGLLIVVLGLALLRRRLRRIPATSPAETAWLESAPVSARELREDEEPTPRGVLLLARLDATKPLRSLPVSGARDALQLRAAMKSSDGGESGPATQTVVLHLSATPAPAGSPSLWRLAVALNLSHAVAPRTASARPVDLSQLQQLQHQPVPQQGWTAAQTREDLDARHAIRRLARGRREVRATALRDVDTTAAVLHGDDNLSAYEWRSLLPRAAGCGSGTDTDGGVVRQCRRVVDVLVVAFVAGCKPVADGDLVGAAGSLALPRLGAPAGCFREGDNELVRDLLLTYVAARCELPHGLHAWLAGLSGVSEWGVGARARALSDALRDERLCADKGRQSY